MWKLKYQSNNDGFTLIELVIVIFIILILAGILLPTFSKVRETGRRTQCASNLKQIGLGLIMYSNENNETFPTGATAMTALNTLYPDYVWERKAFMCPSDNLVTSATNAGITANDPFDKDECSYGYDRTHGPADDPGVAIAGDRPANNPANNPKDKRSPNHGGTVSAAGNNDIEGYGQNVVYVDGHVEWVASQNAGWADASGNRDNVYTGSGGGTDTYILQDGT
jgi:prepilin-type N-terminal cleavage/methylation domain-containing protein/prepilin-type processing-associated H-X9-DG protein